ncbi:MAG: DHH family phosphoesterase [Coriobacteriales bacterium]|jgi:phosphoesterase RecJ-like protein|nr:DHH family phosphoesterase [Coriobacteriales bacterium]
MTADIQPLTIQQALALLEGHQEVAICGHTNPDGDALGSNLALAAWLRARGAKVTSLLAKLPKGPNLYSFLPGYDFVPASEYTGTPDLFVVVDTSTKERIGDGAAVFDRAGQTLVIDHHPDFDGFSPNYFGEPDSPATGLLVWRLLKASGQPITQRMAEYCYVALMTDTGRFSFQNTTQEAFTAAGEMVALGVDSAMMSREVYENRSYSAMLLDSRLVERMRFAGNGAIVYSWVSEADLEELNLSRDETEGLPTLLRSVRSVAMAVLFREEENGVRVNLRAKYGCDVGALAREFGGGGHRAAAGISLEMPLEQAINTIIPRAEQQACLQ